jgi:hypothetical protein
MATVPGGWQVEEYARARHDVPIRAFLAGLEGRNANQAAALLLKLAVRGNQLRPPDSQQVAENLFELRGHQVRIFYMFLPGRRIVLLDGIIKKQDRIPRQDLDRVKAYQADALRRGPRPQ